MDQFFQVHQTIVQYGLQIVAATVAADKVSSPIQQGIKRTYFVKCSPLLCQNGVALIELLVD